MKGHRIRFEITGSDAGKPITDRDGVIRTDEKHLGSNAEKPITGGDKQGFRVKIVGIADRKCDKIQMDEDNAKKLKKLPSGHWEELEEALSNKKCPREKQIGDFYYHIERIGNSL